jgi:hypothetical protein
MSDRPLSERVRAMFGATGTVMSLEQVASEIAALEAERDRLRAALERQRCCCVKAGSSDGTSTVMTQCARCAALQEGGDDE